MARIRSAKPEFWSDAKMGGLKRDVRFTFKGLVEAVSDDWGCFLADARTVKGKVWPFDDDITVRKVSTYLEELAAIGVVGFYTVGGVRYGYITKWFAHQRIDHPTPCQCPEPPGPFARIAREVFASLSDKDRERLARNSRLSGSGSGMWIGMLGAGDGKGAGSGSGAGADAVRDRDPADGPSAAAPSADHADENPETAQLPAAALDLLARMPAEKRPDAQAQLRATLTSTGAKVRKGEVARAQNVRHLEHACRHVLRKMPDEPRVAVVWVLNKLREPWADTDDQGRTVTEAAAQNGKHERAADERDRRQRLADAEEWATEHEADWSAIEARVSAGFPNHERDPLVASALRMALVSAKIEAAEKAAGEPVHAAHGAAGQGGTP